MAPASEPLAGRIVGGRYRVESLLGSGGMGVLYVAEHLLTRRKVALKLLHPSRDDEREQVQARFLSEARTAAAVRHPHVVDVLDMGTDEQGLPFLVMELLEGLSLDRAILNEGSLSPEQTLAYLLPIAGALAVLHDAGIVHRDVKPSNIFLCQTASGRLLPKLLDFGLARVISDMHLTRSGVVIGTPLYMAPEHAAGAHVGPPADVWSLGVVLYECLSGVSPYNSTDSAVIATQIMAGKIRPLDEVCSGLPQSFAHAVERALRRDLEHRYRDMRDLARGLLAGALAGGISVPDDPDPVGLPGFRGWKHISQPVETADGRAHPSSAEVPIPPLKRPVPQDPTRSALSGNLFSLGLAVVVTLSIALVLWLFAQRPSRGPTPALGRDSSLASPRPRFDQVPPKTEPTSPAGAPSAPEKLVAPAVSPREALPGPASPDSHPTVGTIRLAPIAPQETLPPPALKRAKPREGSRTPAATPNGTRSAPKLDVETEWK